MTASTSIRTTSRPLPADLADVALIDATTCAAAGDMSVSWWHDRVATGDAPQPAIRMPRCTRWRVKDVAEFWRDLAQESAADTRRAGELTARAKKASQAAQAKRTQAPKQ